MISDTSAGVLIKALEAKRKRAAKLEEDMSTLPDYNAIYVRSSEVAKCRGMLEMAEEMAKWGAGIRPKNSKTRIKELKEELAEKQKELGALEKRADAFKKFDPAKLDKLDDEIRDMEQDLSLYSVQKAVRG